MSATAPQGVATRRPGEISSARGAESGNGHAAAGPDGSTRASEPVKAGSVATNTRNYVPADYAAIKANLEAAGMFAEPWDSKSNYDSLVAEHPSNILVTEVGGHVVGSLLIDRYGAEGAFIYRLVVHRDHRGAGVASRLLEDAHQTLREQGVKVVALFADAEDSELLAYYAKRGYAQLPHDYAPMWKAL